MTPHSALVAVAIPTLILWLLALAGFIVGLVQRKPRWLGVGTAALLLGWLLLAGYEAWLWHALERLPMRTQGETRLLFVLVLPLLGLALGWAWRVRWIAIPTLVIALVFLIIGIFMPESLDKSQMPALNSPWYAPHVTLYMVSYAMMGLAAAVAIGALIWRMARKDANHAEGDEVVRRLVYLGFPLLTAGLITGAFWGQVAWGHYWTWDPKETWAFVTWAAYLAYLHLDLYTRIKPVAKLVLVTGAFLLLTFCWKGIQLLPSSGQSVHIYSGTN